MLVGCAGPVRKNAVPKTLTTRAVVPGLADVRYRAGIERAVFQTGFDLAAKGNPWHKTTPGY